MCMKEVEMEAPTDNGCDVSSSSVPTTQEQQNNSKPRFLPRIKGARQPVHYNIEQAESHIRQNMGRSQQFHLCEYFTNNPIVNPYYDWDSKHDLEQPAEVAEEHKQRLLSYMRRLHPDSPESDFVLMERHGWASAKGKETYKISWLGKVCNVRMHLMDVKLHMEQVLGKDLPKEFDQTVYKEKEQLLSCVYASKDTDAGIRRVRKPAPECMERPIRDFLCGFTDESQKLITVLPVKKQKANRKVKGGRKTISVCEVDLGGGSDPLKTEVANFVHQQWPHLESSSVLSAEMKEDSIYVLIRGHCPYSDTPHKSNNSYAFLHRDFALFRCHDEVCSQHEGMRKAYPRQDVPVPLLRTPELPDARDLPNDFDGSDHMLAKTFATWYPDSFIYSDGEYYRFADHRYILDQNQLKLKLFIGETFHKDLSLAAQDIMAEADKEGRKRLAKSLAKTRMKSGKIDIVSELAMFINLPEELDANPYLLGVENGVLDLRTCEFRSGQPSDRISKSTGSHYFDDENPDDPALWEEFLGYISQIYPEEEELEAVRRICGYVLLGICPEKTCFIFTDYRDGYTAKSTLMKFFRHALGAYYRKGRNGDLAVDRNQSNQGHSSNWLGYQGFRLAGFEEFDTDFQLNWQTLKDWTGGRSQIGGRDANEKKTVFFEMGAAIFLAFNITAAVDFRKADPAVVTRLILVPHRAKFHAATEVVKYEADKKEGVLYTHMADVNFDDKIIRLAPQFLKWCLLGLKDYHQHRFSNLPESFTRFKNEIVDEPVDQFQEFLTDTLRETNNPEDSVSQAEAYVAYQTKARRLSWVPMSSAGFGVKFRAYMTKKLGEEQAPAAKGGNPAKPWQQKKGGRAHVAMGFTVKPIEKENGSGQAGQSLGQQSEKVQV